MARNEVLEEIYKAREQILAEHGGDVHAYVKSARERFLKSGRPIAKPKSEPEQESGTVNPGDVN